MNYYEMIDYNYLYGLGVNMKKIAIIDDEQDILNLLENALSRLPDVEIILYNNPARAISDVNAGRFDLVLLDIMMPQINGMDLLKVFKTNNENVKIIMMTAFSTQDKMIDCHDFGADDYLTKPFVSLRDVQNKVKDQLSIVA